MLFLSSHFHPCFCWRRRRVDFWKSGWTRFISSMNGAAPALPSMAETCWGFVPCLAESRCLGSGLLTVVTGRGLGLQAGTHRPRKVTGTWFWRWLNVKNPSRMSSTGKVEYCKHSLLTHCWWWCSLTKSCPAIWNPMDCSTPGSSVLRYLPEFAQTHIHWVSDVIQPSQPVTHFSFCSQSSPASGSFPKSQLLASGKSSRASASASVLPVNIQGWFPLGLTGLISLLSKELSRVFSSITVQRHHSSELSLLYGPTLTSVHDYWKNYSFD